MRSNCSQVPIAVRLAIRAWAPAFSAVTYLLFASANRLTVPLELWMSWKVSQVPIAVRLAISGEAPALSAVTYMLLARDRRLTTVVVVLPVVGWVGRVGGRAIWLLSMAPPSLVRRR